MGEPNHPSNIEELAQQPDPEGDERDIGCDHVSMALMPRVPSITLTFERPGLRDRLYFNEEIEIREDATNADLIELRRQLMLPIARFNNKEKSE